MAYHWFVEQENSQELRLVATNDPARPRVLFKTLRPEYVEPFALTPDGTQVVVGRTLADRTSQLGLVSTGNGSYKSIKSLDWRYPLVVSLSPDGRYLAYDVPAGDAGSPRDILLLALDGSSEITAVSGPGDDSRPLWTADGSRLVSMSNRSGNPSLWSVSVEAGRVSGSPQLVKANTGRSSRLVSRGLAPFTTAWPVAPDRTSTRLRLKVSRQRGVRVSSLSSSWIRRRDPCGLRMVSRSRSFRCEADRHW